MFGKERIGGKISLSLIGKNSYSNIPHGDRKISKNLCDVRVAKLW